MVGRVDSKGERKEGKGDLGMRWMKRPFWPEGSVGKE